MLEIKSSPFLEHSNRRFLYQVHFPSTLVGKTGWRLFIYNQSLCNLRLHILSRVAHVPWEGWPGQWVRTPWPGPLLRSQAQGATVLSLCTLCNRALGCSHLAKLKLFSMSNFPLAPGDHPSTLLVRCSGPSQCLLIMNYSDHVVTKHLEKSLLGGA